MILTNVPIEQEPTRKPGSIRCSFCGREQRDVRYLFARGYGTICDACVRDAVALMGQQPEAG